ncbi:tetratricopeptide repeat protein [Acrocarpospora phusangensis]|uniref:tetratricopeptide repeat protein n=1 Tax=Acrocarpospora phusangensis TaxID=1070424 RepID=UPI001EF17C03|nr:tetratricopeptide repeat protein [Acrocarpospora phusangensis]
MAHVTREQLDRLLEQALLLDDHGALARQLDVLAESYESGEVSRAAILVLAAEEWRQSGQPAAALDRFQRAADDGGEVPVDPRAGIADTLFELERPDEARDMIAAIGASGWTPATALTIAETLVAYGDLDGAHTWATDGVDSCPPGLLRESLLRTRYRIRIDLGLPEDDLDALLDISR